MDSGFRASETFVTSGEWSGKRLPDEWLDRIGCHKAARLSDQVGTPRAGVEPSDVARLCAEYRAGRAYTTRQFLTRVFRSAATLAIRAV